MSPDEPDLTDADDFTREIAETLGHSSGSAVEIRPGLVLRSRFTLGKRIAGGGIGELYQAIDRRRIEADYPDPFVAIKVLSRNYQRMTGAVRILQYEAILAQRLIHPNLVRVFDIDRHAGVYFVTMEWLRGESLAQRLNRTETRPMPWAAIRRILGDVGMGLDFAHRNGVVHGDVKPANVFLTTRCQVKLVDFGLACAVGGRDETRRSGQIVLTPAYASCEVHEGLRPTAQDDVFALAIMAYQMIAGFHPFENCTAVEAEKRNIQPVRPSSLSSVQWAALRKGLAFRREERSLSVAVLIEKLVRRPNKRFLKPWPPWARVASLLYAVGLSGWYLGSNQIGGPGESIESPIVPEKVPSRLHSPPTSDKADRPGIELASDEPIIALESVSGQDVRIDDPFFRET